MVSFKFWKIGYISILAPISFKNSLIKLACAGHAGEVTRLPST
jgi:hypothetical protein